jgi:hypothetical protein
MVTGFSLYPANAFVVCHTSCDSHGNCVTTCV